LKSSTKRSVAIDVRDQPFDHALSLQTALAMTGKRMNNLDSEIHHLNSIESVADVRVALETNSIEKLGDPSRCCFVTKLMRIPCADIPVARH